MNVSGFLIRLFLVTAIMVCLASAAEAQRGLRGQIYLPNGAPIQKVTRYTLITANGSRNDILFTDSNGRILIPSPPVGEYTITVDSDGELYDTTTQTFNTSDTGNFVGIHLQPLRVKRGDVIGKVNAGDVDREVSPKAREVYDSALELIKTGKYEQAIEPLKQAIAIDRNYFHAHNDLGVVYMKLKRYPEAEVEFKQAIKINDGAYLAHLNLGLVLNRQKKYQESAAVLLKTQRRHPEVDNIHLPLIEALFGAQMWRDAEVEVKQAMNVIGIDRVDMQIKLGAIYLKQVRYTEAVSVLREAVITEPENALGQFNYGAALLQLGKLDEAEAALSRSYELKGAQMPGAQLMLGQLYFQKKNYPKAIESFEFYLRDLPNAPNAAEVKEAIARLRQSVKQP